jgi:hypothetical protein
VNALQRLLGVSGNDGGVRQLGTMSGSIDAGLAVALSVPVVT